MVAKVSYQIMSRNALGPVQGRLTFEVYGVRPPGGASKGRINSTTLTLHIEGFLPTRCAGRISCYMPVDSVTVRASCHSLLRGWPYSPLGDIARARFRLHLPVAAV